MDSLTNICYHFANSPKRQQYFERFIDYYKDELSVAASSRSHVIGLSKTRWVERYKAYENYYLSTVNLPTKDKVYSQFVLNLTTLLLFQCCLTV